MKKRWWLILVALVLIAILLLWGWRHTPSPPKGDVGQTNSCIDRAALKVPEWKSEGKSNIEIERLYQKEIALCSGVAGSCSAFAGAVNADYTWLGRQVLSQSLSPAQYLMRVRDRSRKMRQTRKTPEICDAYVKGDADGDLVPDDRDKCANTPNLDPTDADGCPDKSPPPVAPTVEQVQNAAKGLKVPLTQACQQTSIPDGSAVLREGLDPSNSDSFLIEISPVTNQPPKCPVFYEIEVRLQSSSFFSGTSHLDVFRRVFRAADAVTISPAQQQQLVFQLKHSDPIPWDALVKSGVEPSDHALKFIRVECPAFSVPVRNDKTGSERILRWHEARSIRRSRL